MGGDAVTQHEPVASVTRSSQEQRAALATRLGAVPTSTATVVLGDLGVRQVVLAGVRPIVPPAHGAVAGPARTLRFLPSREDVQGLPRGPRNRALVDTIGPGEVLVIDASGRRDAAVLGDMLATRARHRAAAAVVTDGAVRDAEGLRDVGLPVFAAAIHPAPSGSRLLPWDTDVAVSCGGVLVQPGDWVLADADAVVVLPAALVAAVAERAETALARDAFSQRLLAAGFPLDEAYPLPPSRATEFDRFGRDGSVPRRDR